MSIKITHQDGQVGEGKKGENWVKAMGVDDIMVKVEKKNIVAIQSDP